MKVRIGFGIGAAPRLFADPGELGRVVDQLDAEGWDSVWFPERVNAPQLDPIVAMGYVAGRSERLKFGPAVTVVPGRNPVLLAKALASLDVVSGGRCLPAVGLGIANSAEHQAFGVERRERAPWFDEALPLMRRLWAGETVEHHGERFTISGARIRPLPVQDPFDVWLGGQAPSELRRCGRLGDGWLASFTTPRHVAAGKAVIEEAAAAAGRTIDPEHFGVLIPTLAEGPVPEPLAAAVAARRPDAEVTEVVATSPAHLAEMIAAHLAVGASKFVVFPAAEPEDWHHFITRVGAGVLDLQT